MENESIGTIADQILTQFPVTTSVSDEQMAENVKSAMSRKLKTIDLCKPHKLEMSIAAGGPSLEDTYKELSGVIAAVNGSLGFLLERGVKPWGCGVLDPGDHMHTIVERHPDVFYFVASVCHPSTFDHLKDCKVIIWHPSGQPCMKGYEKKVPVLVSGGTTMGLRWINLGLVLGFRSFHLHGLDSSFRGKRTHAYPDRRDGQQSVIINGRSTTRNFLEQISDFDKLRKLIAETNIPVEMQVYGDGLFQDHWKAQ